MVRIIEGVALRKWEERNTTGRNNTYRFPFNISVHTFEDHGKEIAHPIRQQEFAIWCSGYFDIGIKRTCVECYISACTITEEDDAACIDPPGISEFNYWSFKIPDGSIGILYTTVSCVDQGQYSFVFGWSDGVPA